MNDKKTKTSLPFIRAYNILLERKDLKPAEKLVLLVICRYLPSPFWGSNSTIAKNLGCSVRRVERLLKKLKCKGVIKAGYAHKGRNGKNHTVRVIVPLCIPAKCVLTDFKIDTGQIDGQDTGQKDGSTPSIQSQTTVKTADLLERSRKRIERARSLPLPALGQAKTLTEDQPDGEVSPASALADSEAGLKADQLRERLRKQIALLKAS
jgi:hypothetical protein